MSANVTVTYKSAVYFRLLHDGKHATPIPLDHGRPFTRYKEVDNHSSCSDNNESSLTINVNSDNIDSHYNRDMMSCRAAPILCCDDGSHL